MSAPRSHPAATQQPRRPRLCAAGAVMSVVALVVAACASPAPSPSSSAPSASPIRIGAVFPLSGNAGALAREELFGVETALDLVNGAGGADGRPLVLDVKDLEAASDAPAIMASLATDGVSVVVGAYSSDLSIAASQAADAAGLVYWEAGAVADRLTGRGLPLVFRVGASGTNLGSNSASFAATQLAPRLGRSATSLRLAIVNAQDAYASSVADAAATTATTAGTSIVARLSYNLSVPDWPTLMSSLAAARPDVIILASHIPDGVAFRRAMLAAGLHVGALIGSTMAECDPDFAGDLGSDAVGIFASDRPTGGFQPTALDPGARALYGRLADAWLRHPIGSSSQDSRATSASTYGDTGAASPGTLSPWSPSSEGASASPEYPIIGPVVEGSAAAGPSEEALSGFSAAWVLAHDVLPAAAAASGSAPDAAAVAAAARAVDLPTGSLPNGAGVRFSADPATLGQNERPAAVIWQWQAVRTYGFVWPATYATSAIGFVPLAR